MPKTFYEIFREVAKCRTKKEKIAKLREHSSASMKQVLGWTYDDRVKWLLPEGEPPYKPVADGIEAEGRLVAELKRMYIFIEGDTDTQRNLKQVRREQLFIVVLEAVDPGDAKVLLGMNDGKLPFNVMTKKLVAEAFPNLSKHW